MRSWTAFRHVLALAALLLAAACAAHDPDRQAGSLTAPARAGAPSPRPAPDPSPAGGTPTPAATDADATPGEAQRPCDDPLGCYEQPVRVGSFDAALVAEASGVAVSRRHDDVLYLLDDRPGTSELWVVRTDGTTLGAVGVLGLDAVDTESLGSGPCGPGDPEPCLYVGDIGDNRRRREHIVVHRLAEPDLDAGMPSEPLPADAIKLRYPGGPWDAEALLVDDDGVPYLVTKAPFDPETGVTGETRLYQAPGFADGELIDLGPVPVPPPSTPRASVAVGNVVTGADQRPGRVLLRTYDQVLEYVAPAPDAPLAGFPDWTVREVPSAFEWQSEAIAWAADGCGYYTVGEMVGDIWFAACRP